MTKLNGKLIRIYDKHNKPMGVFEVLQVSPMQELRSFAILALSDSGEIDQFSVGDHRIELVRPEVTGGHRMATVAESPDVQQMIREQVVQQMGTELANVPPAVAGTTSVSFADLGKSDAFAQWANVEAATRAGFKSVQEAGEAMRKATAMLRGEAVHAAPRDVYCCAKFGFGFDLGPTGDRVHDPKCHLFRGAIDKPTTITWHEVKVHSHTPEQSDTLATPTEDAAPDFSKALVTAAEERDAARAELERVRTQYEKVVAAADVKMRELRDRIAKLTAVPSDAPSMTEGTEELDGRLFYKGTAAQSSGPFGDPGSRGGDEVPIGDGAAYKEWARHLVAERNEARRLYNEAQSKLDAFTATTQADRRVPRFS